MSKEIVKAIFDENIAGAREDLTFDAYFDSIKGNEEYKKGLFENYVSDGKKSYEEFNAETFGMGKPEAPSEVGGAESSPTGLGLSESEVGPPAGGTPPGAEPVGAPVSDAIEPIEPGEPEAPAVTVGLEEFNVIDNKKDKGFLETIFGWLGGEKTFERVESKFEDLTPSRQRLFQKGASKQLSEQIGGVFTEAEKSNEPEKIIGLAAKGYLSTNTFADYLAGDFASDKVAAGEINTFLENNVEGQSETFKRFKGNIDPVIAEQSNEIKETMLKDRDYIGLTKEIDREFASQRAEVDAKYIGVIDAEKQVKLNEATVGLLAEYDAAMLSLPTESDVTTKKNEMLTRYQLLVNDGKMDSSAANAELQKEYNSYVEGIKVKADEIVSAYNSGLEKAAEKIQSGLKDSEEYKQYISELTELRNGIVSIREEDLRGIQTRIQGDLAPKYNERINSAIKGASSGPTPLLEKSGLLPTIQKVLNNKGFDLLPFDQKKSFLDRAFGNVVVQLREKGVAINDGTIAQARNEFDDAVMSKAYFTQKGTPSLYMLKTRAIEEAEKLDEVIASTKAKTGTKTFTSGVYASEFGQQGKGYDDKGLDQLLLAREKLQEIIDLPENMTNNEFTNFWNGLSSGQFVDYLPFVSGLKNLSGSLALYRSLEDDTPASRYLQNAVALGNSYKGVYEANNMASDWYKAGASTAESLPFMGEFVFTAGMGSLARKSTEKVVAKLLGEAAEKTIASKGMRVLAGTVVGALAQTTANPQRYLDETIKRMTPQMSIAFSEEGDDLVAVLDESTAEGGFEAFLKGYGVTASEYFSENLGFAGARALKYAGSKMMQNEFLKRAYIGWSMSKLNIDMPTAFKRLAEKGGWNGFFAEFGEELANIPLTNLITGDADVMAGILTESGDLDIESLMEVGRALVPISAFGVGVNVGGIAVKSMTPEKVTISYRDINNLPATETIDRGAWEKVTEALKSPDKLREFISNELPRLKVEGKAREIITRELESGLGRFEGGVVESTKPPQAKGAAETQPAPKISVQMVERKRLSADRKRLVGTGKFDFTVTIDGKEQKISRAEYNEYKRSGKLPEGIGADVLGEVDRVEGVVVESTKDAESIKTSLEGVEVPAELGTIENVAEVYEQAKGKEELTDAEVAVVDFVEGSVAKVEGVSEGVSEGAVEIAPEAGSGGVGGEVVKDDKGVPVKEGIWYHGSPTEGLSGKDLKPNEKGLLFFTRDKNIAERYATNDYEGNTTSNNVFERKLEVDNIFDPEKNSDNAEIIDLLASKGNFENAGRFADFDALAKEALENGEWSVLETKEFIDGLKKLGYDAIYIDNRPYYSENREGKRTFSRDIAVFDTKQHKAVEQPLKESPEAVTPEAVTPEVSGVAEVAEGQPIAETSTQPLTLKEKAKEAKQKADEALKEFDRLTEERRNTGEGISPLGRAERLADLDKKRLKEIIDYLKFAAQSKAYSFADFISQLLERDIVLDYNNPEDRAFYEKHSGKKISEEQPKSIGITNAYDEAAREARGADPIAKKASTTNKQVWDEAMEITKRKDVPAQIAVWASQDGFVDANPINQALILYDRIRIENEREILLKQIGKASDSKLVSIYERLAALEVETDLNETANKNLGRTWGVTGAFRQALADRAYTITGVIARAKAISGKGLAAADEVRLTNMAKEIELLQKQKAELEKKLSEELAKERVAAENKVMNEARRKPLPGTTTGEDLKKAVQKWLESKNTAGIMFDPKSSAKADIELFEAILDYLKSQAVNTIAKVKKVITDYGLEVDDEGAAFILEELKARGEAEKPKKPAVKKKPTTPKEPSKKIEEKSIDELLSDISEKAEGQIDETNISSLRPYFAEVIRKEVANGAETLDQIVDKIYDKLLETIPSLTKADLKDAMSGYGQFRELSKEELDVKIREVKRIGRLEAALRDVEEKLKLPKRTGVEQDQLSAKARALRQQILKAISDLGITPELTDEELAAKWQSARDAYKRRLDNAIADVELEIANKEKKAKKQPTEFNDQEIADLRASLKALRDVRDNIPEIKANEADRKLSAKIEATKKKITEAERKIAEGDLSVKETEKLTSPELDTLREELKGLNEQLSKMREDAKPEAQQISEAQARLDGAARREINRLEALRNKVLADGIGAEDVNAGEIATIKQKKKFPNLKRADALQVQIDNLRRAISDLIPEDVKQEALVQKYLASREKVLERLTKKYDNKDYETKKRPVPPASKEIAAVNRKINEKKKEIETDLERIRLRNRAMIEKLGGGLIDLAALAKSLIASVDLSAPLRQGIVYAVTEPKIFAKVFLDMFKFTFSEKNYQNWLNEVKEDPRFDEYTSRYKLHISDQTGKMSAREEQFMSKFFGVFKKIPVYGQLLTGSERAYAGFINKLRWDVFQKYVEEVESMGLTKEEADVELKALAKFVNTATGRGELGVLSSAAVPLNSLLFSPRLVSSRLHPFMMPFLYSKMPKLARQKALKTYATFFGSIITTMVLLSFLMDDDKDEGIELDPRSSDFLKIRFQDYRVDPFGGYQQAIVAISKLFGGVKSTRTEEVKNFSDEGFGQQTREDIIENYFTNKLAPVPATIYRNYIKPSPMDEANSLYSVLFGEVAKDQRSAMRKVGETIFDLTIPLYADDLIGVLSDDDVDLKTSVLAGSTIFGVGGGKYGGKTILRPGSKEFRVMKDMTVAQPRFDTEVKIPEYGVDKDGQIVKVLDEDGKEKKKFLTTSQTKEYNKMLRNTYSSFVNSIEEDFRASLSDEEKKKLADFLLKKSKDIANWEYFVYKTPSKKSDISGIQEMIDAEKDRIKGILSYGESPYNFVFDAMTEEGAILTPKAINPKENE